MNKVTCICLGVRDMGRSVRFYRDGLGFATSETRDEPKVIFFSTPGTKLELYRLDQLAEDISAEAPPPIAQGFAGITLACNVQRREEVDEIIRRAEQAGAYIAKRPQEVFWGGYHAYFADPDGYYWEVAWGPDFKYDSDGLLIMD